MSDFVFDHQDFRLSIPLGDWAIFGHGFRKRQDGVEAVFFLVEFKNVILERLAVFVFHLDDHIAFYFNMIVVEDDVADPLIALAMDFQCD